MNWAVSGDASRRLPRHHDRLLHRLLPEDQPEIRGCGLHDPLAVAAALDPSLVTTFGFNLQVNLEGPFRGRTIGDRSRLQDPDKHTQVALGVNVPEFLDRFMTRVTAAAR